VSVALSPDGKTILTGGRDGAARQWEAATGKALGAPLAHSWLVLAVAFSPDGKILLTGGGEGIGRLWDAATCKPIGPPMFHSAANLRAVAFGKGGRTAWTASWDRTLCRWPVPAAVEVDAEAIRLWAEVLTGMELDRDGTVCILAAKTWEQRRRQRDRCNSIGGGPG
jgi:WD40 repeat protein